MHAKGACIHQQNVGAIVFSIRRALTTSLVVLASVTFAATAHAIPALQLYSPDALYDTKTSSWLITSNSFELWVVADTGDKGEIYDVDLAASCYGSSGSVVITPDKPIDPNPSHELEYNTVTQHAEYANADSHLFWSLGDFAVGTDPIMNYVDGSGATTGTIMKLMVNVSGFDAVHFDAFDHYVTGAGGQANYQIHPTFAPFSHDLTDNGVGGSGGAGGDAPEPGTLSLVGFGIAGMLAARKKKRTT